MIIVTKNVIKRVRIDWEKIAKTEVSVRFVKGAFWGFTSELGALRLEHEYNNRAKASASYSVNLKSWMFTLETENLESE